MSRAEFVCPNGHRRVITILSPEEAQEARRRGEPVGGQVFCPEDGLPMTRRG